MEGKIVYFDKPGAENTEEVLRIARMRAEELNIKTIVVATTVGDTAIRAVEVFKKMKVIVVTHYTGMKGPNIQELTEENRKKIENKHGVILTTAHVFTGIGGAMRKKFNMYLLGDIMANTLRIFGQGIKVCCEITMMAADAGQARTDEDIIAIAGTGRGADTAIVVTPVNSMDFFEMKIKEILCKPRF